MQKKVYSVSDLTLIIKSLLEESLPTFWVEGEISNLKPHYSGHLYFTLKDQNAQLSSVMWRTRAEQLSLKIEDGMLVRCLGNIKVYEKHGKYQFDILNIESVGAGFLQEKFEQLKRKLYDEGLFSQEVKKKLPVFPETIAIITSPTGAAIKDILSVLKRRAPYVKIILKPVKVQGEGASRQIADAIESVNKENLAEVIIAGRGGGSLEDLWAFNEEVVARAIYNSSIPVISAVGHEIDFTIADFVADLRAPTPSAAAELAIPDKNEIAGLFAGYRERMISIMKNLLNGYRHKVDFIKNSYGLKRYEDSLYQNFQYIDELSLRLNSSFNKSIEQNLYKTNFLHKMLISLNPVNILSRGYSITFMDGKPVTDTDSLQEGQQLETKLFHGSVKSLVNEITKGSDEKKY
jgi:exodeoxyribonuclease VII large subunit